MLNAKKIILTVFTWLKKSKMAAKMATTFGDVTDHQQRHQPYYVPHLREKINGFPLKAKSFRNTATHQKLKGGVPSTSPVLYQGWGMTLRIRPRVNTHFQKIVIMQSERLASSCLYD